MKLVLDAATRAKLHDLTEQLELYDEGGKLIAIVVPSNGACGRGSLADPFSAEEVERALRNTGPTRPLADILRDHEHA